jgi:fluoride exporter
MNARLDPRELAGVFIGGCAGALARAAFNEAVPVRAGVWPWSTFAVNVAGALAIGYAATRLGAGTDAQRRARSFATSGVCGALTTFSTMMLEVERLLELGDAALAGAYVAASVAAGFAAVLLGRSVALATGVTAAEEE